jgi:hypothetical protein
VPVTPAHAAAAWPLSRLLPRLPLEALILGTMTPDFEYLLRLAPRGSFGHTPLGLLVFCLPIGLMVWTVYQQLVRPASLTLLPAGLRDAARPVNAGVLTVAAALLIGAGSHSLWDSFTHGHGWGVRHVPVLATPLHVEGRGVPLFKMLQHASTVLGLVVVTCWAIRWVRRQPASARTYQAGEASRATRIVALLVVAAAAGALLNGLRAVHRGPINELGYAAVGGMDALTLALVIFGLTTKSGQSSQSPFGT